jgi:predicted exporter
VIERLLAAWGVWLVRAPRLSICALAAVTLGAIAALPRFRIDSDVASLFPRGDETIELLREVEKSSGEGARTMFLLVRGEHLEERLRDLLTALAESPYLEAVAGTKEELGGEIAARARAAPLYFLPESAIDELETRLAPEGRRAALEESKRLLAEDPALGREIVLRDPLGLRWIMEAAARAALPGRFEPSSPYLLVDQGRAAFVRLLGKKEPFDIEYSRALLADVETRSAGFEIEEIGGYAVARSDASRIRRDMESSLYWEIPVLVAFLVLSTRSLYLPLALLVPVSLAVLWALGYGGLLLGPLTPLAVSSAAILMGMGIDFGIHYSERYANERRSAPHAEAVVRTHRDTGRAIFYGMATTVVAFLTIGLGSFASLESFGVLLTLGLVWAWIATLTAMPLLLARMRSSTLEHPHAAHWRALSRFVRTRACRGAALSLAVVSALGWGAVLVRGVRIDGDPNHLRPPEARLDVLFTRLANLLGFSPLGAFAFVPADTSVETIAEAAAVLEAEGWSALSEGPHRLTPTKERRARVELFRERTRDWIEGTEADMRELGFRPESFASSLGEWKAHFDAEPPGPTDSTQFLWQGSRYWRTSFHPRELAATKEERARFHGALERTLPPGTLILDPSALADRIGPLLAGDLRRSSGLSALAVVLLVFLGVREPRASLVALAPVFAGLGITLGLASVLAWPLHPGNFIAVALILGLGVDAGIHLVLRRMQGSTDIVLDTGVALWRTSVTTCIGFGSLVASESPALTSLGILVLVGMSASFLASMLMVPVLLEWTPWSRLSSS